MQTKIPCGKTRREFFATGKTVNSEFQFVG